MALLALWRAVTRRKSPDLCQRSDAEKQSPLARVLSTVDLTALGVGSTLGVGVYVLAGSVARDMAGPAVVISFAIAALASVFAGLCYAEFGARVPLAGSAYIYSYVSIGEFMAFVIGWNLIMEYVIGCASVARGLSNYLDQLMGNAMQDSFERLWHLHVSFLSPYVDFFAFGISFLLSVVLAVGVKESMALNNLFTLVNLSIVLFVIVAGAFKADISNWEKDKSDIPAGYRGGQGGFFPFGAMGVLKGAATCFYGFVGFDCIATTGEEVRNPQRAIPLAIIVSLFIIFLSYFGVSAVLTLMWPYYMQDADAPLPYVFEQIGWPFAQWVVAIGGIFGLFASLFGAMYPLPRVIYAMANDGLLFRFLGEVHPRYKTPLVGTLLAGLLTGLMAALFKLQQLVNMLSIGTLMAYTIVAACVLILRYKHEFCEVLDSQGKSEEAMSLLSDDPEKAKDLYQTHDSDSDGALEYKETTNLVTLVDRPTLSKLFYQLFNWHSLKTPTPTSCYLVNIEVAVFCCLSVALGLCLVHMENGLEYGRWGPLTIVCILGALLLLVLLSIALQPMSKRPLAFKVPLVPAIPAVSITLNIYLMLMLDLHTWIRFAIWMAVGVGVYFITVPCRKLNFCCAEHVSSLPTTALEPQLETPSALSSSIVTENRPNGLLSNGIKNNGTSCIVEAAENASGAIIIKHQSEVEENINNVNHNLVSSLMEENIEVIPSIGIRVQCPTPESESTCSKETVEEVIDMSLGSDYQTLEAVKSEIAIQEEEEESSNTAATEEEEECRNEEKGIVQAKNGNVLFRHTLENLDFLESKIKQETLENDNQHKPIAVSKDDISLKEVDSPYELDFVSDRSSNPDKSLINLNNLNPHVEAATSNDDDNMSECDVRSLYPNVVVISSSEEDAHSEVSLSFNGSVEQTEEVPLQTFNLINAITQHSEGNDNSCILENDIGQDHREEVIGENLDSLPTSNTEVKEMPPSSRNSISSSRDIFTGDSEIENGTEVPLSQETSKNLPSDESNAASDDRADNDTTTPLKNVTFVAKLEKIIQNQAKGVEQKSSNFRKAYSLSDIADSMKSSARTEQMVPSEPSANGRDNQQISDAEQKPPAPTNLDEGLPGVDTQNDDVFETAADSENNVEDIRTRLERIFSTGRSPQVSSLILRNSSPTKLNAREHSDKHTKSTDHHEDADENEKMIHETRRLMANVLGTIRQKNRKNSANVKDFFDQKDDK